VQLPVIEFSVETVGALVEFAKSPPILVLTFVVVGVVILLSVRRVRDATRRLILPKSTQGLGPYLKWLSDHRSALAIGGLLIVTLSALALELPSRAIQNQLVGDQVTKLLTNNELSGQLAREQYCDAIANNPKVVRRFRLICPGVQWRVHTGKASPTLTAWHAELVLLVILALLLAIFVFRNPEDGAKNSSVRQVTMATAAFLTVLAVGGLPYAYGAVFRSVNPLQVRIFRGGPTFCSGYLLSRDGSTVTMYNAGAGIVETVFAVTKISTLPPGQRNDLLEAQFNSTLRSADETTRQECK